jgi:hypothetical protein
MKKALLIPLFFLIAYSASAQDIFSEDPRPIPNFLIKRGYRFPDSAKEKEIDFTRTQQWPDTLYYNTPYKSKLLGSFTIPFYFSNIEIADNKITVTPAVNLGVGYTWFWGDFIFNENDKITIEPTVSFGVLANTGLQSGLNLKEGGLFLGGFVGVSAFTLIFGYDAINKSPSLGIGGRIDFYTISQNFLHILGKVHEVRKHKSIAPKITGE